MTGYYKKGNLVMKRGLIVRHYLRTWFIIDLLATIPLSWFFEDLVIDYWPDDGFDETEEIIKDDQGILFSKSYVDTTKYSNTLSVFDIA